MTQEPSGTAPEEPDEALLALAWNWGDAYVIGRGQDGAWWYQRRDGGPRLTAADPRAVRRAVRADYARCPVSRVTSQHEEERRDAYEALGARIWHDHGGWHARWGCPGEGTGISCPGGSLAGLLDAMDAARAR